MILSAVVLPDHQHVLDFIKKWLDEIGFWVAIASFVANFLPPASLLDRWPSIKKVYEGIIKAISAAAINIRFRLPSLDLSLPGWTKPPDVQHPPTVQELRRAAKKVQEGQQQNQG